jgi:RecG-like helicase
LAPTKPLVHQQAKAIHSVSGIPNRDVAELTGEKDLGERLRAVSTSTLTESAVHLLDAVGTQASLLHDTSNFAK